jgi:wyosine [tRNA(Phe)-imidazoG37] synthetase (radical SAM superfamily)
VKQVIGNSPAAAPVPPAPERPAPPRAHDLRETAFGCPRDFLENRFVYTVLSPRARGLSVGVNMNPEKACNFRCVYCEVNWEAPPREAELDVAVMQAELKHTLALVRDGQLRQRAAYRTVPEEVLRLQHVTLSGDGEPTLAPRFNEAVQAVVHVRASGRLPYFKLVLITNATGLHLPQVQRGLRFFTSDDEVWAKLDGGTQTYLNRINGAEVPLEQILSNILALGRRRPVVIQSLFAAFSEEQEPPAAEIAEYTQRLNELKSEGAHISLVQIYSATRPTPNSRCGHLQLKALSGIAHSVRQATGLKVEIF